MTRRDFIAAGITGVGALAVIPIDGQNPSNSTPNIEDFFRDFTADWVRHDPNLATSARYFFGRRAGPPGAPVNAPDSGLEA